MNDILIVEDSPTILTITAQILTEGGYRVITATDGEEALRVAAEQQPAVIVLDVILPKLNGFQVCRELKARPDTSHIPIVMITSKTRDADRQWGIEQGADDYVVKPFRADELLVVVDRVASRN